MAVSVGGRSFPSSSPTPILMSLNSPDWLQEIDHTGDIGIQVTAASLPELFERAALGMFAVLTDLPAVSAEEDVRVTVEGRDREALMVRWLSELNYHHTVDHQLFCDIAVEAIEEEPDGFVLTGTARGEPLDPERHTVYTEIKAITFHGMDVRRTETGWAVQIIFDM